jgi:hypothetical protein
VPRSPPSVTRAKKFDDCRPSPAGPQRATAEEVAGRGPCPLVILLTLPRIAPETGTGKCLLNMDKQPMLPFPRDERLGLGRAARPSAVARSGPPRLAKLGFRRWLLRSPRPEATMCSRPVACRGLRPAEQASASLSAQHRSLRPTTFRGLRPRTPPLRRNRVAAQSIAHRFRQLAVTGAPRLLRPPGSKPCGPVGPAGRMKCRQSLPSPLIPRRMCCGPTDHSSDPAALPRGVYDSTTKQSAIFL